jgi:hypothetical protein
VAIREPGGPRVIGSLLVLALVLGPVQAYNEGNRLYAQKDYAGRGARLRGGAQVGVTIRARTTTWGTRCSARGGSARPSSTTGRAYYLAPRDHDVEANLAFARAYRVDKSTGGSSPLAHAAERALRWLSRREAAMLAGVLFTLAGLALSAWIVWRAPPLAGAAGVLALLGLYAFCAQQLWAGEVASRPAVVIVPEVSAASGPGEEFKQVLLLH